MHNILSRNQLAEWNLEDTSDTHEADLMNDYFDCLIECDETQQSCKRICKKLLV